METLDGIFSSLPPDFSPMIINSKAGFLLNCGEYSYVSSIAADIVIMSMLFDEVRMPADQTTHIERVLNFWLGDSVRAPMPDPQRTRLWFANDILSMTALREYLEYDVQAAQQGQYTDWQITARGSLGLIILLGVVPKQIYPGQPIAYQHDATALTVCQAGIQRELEHQLALVERVFFYRPLLDAEDLMIQRQSVTAYQALLDYSLDETKLFYQTFLALALHNFEVIEQFGRFPERNLALGRQDTRAELAYLHI